MVHGLGVVLNMVLLHTFISDKLCNYFVLLKEGKKSAFNIYESFVMHFLNLREILQVKYLCKFHADPIDIDKKGHNLNAKGVLRICMYQTAKCLRHIHTVEQERLPSNKSTVEVSLFQIVTTNWFT